MIRFFVYAWTAFAIICAIGTAYHAYNSDLCNMSICLLLMAGAMLRADYLEKRIKGGWYI